MNKNLFRSIFSFIPIIIIFLVNIINVLPKGNDSSYDYSYDETDVFEISDYYVEITATDDRTCKVYEAIDVEFFQARASIIRDLPTNGGIEYRDIVVKNRVFSVYKSGDFLEVDYEADNFTPSLQPRSYEMTYTLDYSKAIWSNMTARDMIPLNVIGTGWTVNIRNATIVINLPEAPVSSYYYVGRVGATGGANRLNITPGGKSVIISTKDTLEPYEGITVGYEMPKSVMKSSLDSGIVLNLLLAAAWVVLVYIVFSMFGKDQEITPVVNFKPPKDMNPAEAGYLIDGTVSPADMTSLIYYWASQNHIHIKDISDGKNIELIKISDLDDKHSAYEKIMFTGLFKLGQNTVRVSTLKEKYYTTLSLAQTSLYNTYKGLLYNGKALFISLLMMILTVIAATVYVNIGVKVISSEYSSSIGLVSIIFFLVSFVIATGMIRYEPKITKSKTKFYLILGGIDIVFSIILFFIFRGALLPLYNNMIISAALGVTMFIIPFIQMRSDYYHDILNDLLGFRNFILTAEKDRLEMLLKDNPDYYYNILPYANVLGISDIWMKKFSTLTVPPPTWYYTNRGFNLYVFNTSFTRSVNTISSTMVSRPAPSGSSGRGFGGGFGGGGGGFSGGGFGGGGGHSR